MKKLKPYYIGVYYSLPVQLLLLHFKRYQVLLFFWYILFATVNGSFMHPFGAHMLYLYPEYLGEVNALSLALVGAGVAIFIMSWNITTFILHARQIRFLATTTQPFLKYCINNGVIPLTFLLFYFFKIIQFGLSQELLPVKEIWLLVGGFITGLIVAISIAFTYFFGADKTIYRFMDAGIKEELLKHKNKFQQATAKRDKSIIRIDWYLSATLKTRRPRSVRHYPASILDAIFKQHHLVALFSILIALVSLITTGFFLDNKYFQLPAAASITVLFAVLIGVAGAFSYFLQSWSVLFLLLAFLGINILYQQKIIDPTNRAYGLDYNKNMRPEYNSQSLNNSVNAAAVLQDSLNYISILNNWKAKQGTEKPVFMIACVSGGGNRATAFSMNVLRQLDVVTNDKAGSHLFLISGASGGMIGAAWYRELLIRKKLGLISADEYNNWADDVSGDLLNPLFSSFIARDLLSPPQKFTYKGFAYKKDRGFAFEEKLNSNTHGFMNQSLAAYKNFEDSAIAPLLLINAVITRDGRKLVMATRPSRFLAKPFAVAGNKPDADAVDFISFFANEQSSNVRLLSALRMNATFPYVLPNVWLPSEPVIDVMDAGFRDNTGLETALKFLYIFKTWLQQNCSKVVLVQVSDKKLGGWQNPYESNSILDIVTKPALLTQNNLFRFQEYNQQNQIAWFQHLYGPGFSSVLFTYQPTKKEAAASLSFHLTQLEKRDLKASLQNIENKAAFTHIERLIR